MGPAYEENEKELDWRSYASSINPSSKKLVTANNDVRTQVDGVDANKAPAIVSLHMGPERANRINELLDKREKHNVESFKNILGKIFIFFVFL